MKPIHPMKSIQPIKPNVLKNSLNQNIPKSILENNTSHEFKTPQKVYMKPIFPTKKNEKNIPHETK